MIPFQSIHVGGNLWVMLSLESLVRDWPTHVTDQYEEQPHRSRRVVPITNAPDPPPEPYPQAKKQKITRAKGMFKSKRVTPDVRFPLRIRERFFSYGLTGLGNLTTGSLEFSSSNSEKMKFKRQIALKNRFVTCKESCIPKRKRWIRDVPYTVREGATHEMNKAISDRFGDAKRMGKPFRPPTFRSKYDDVKSINIDTQNICKKPDKRWRFYVTSFPDTLRIRQRDQRRVLDTMPDGPVRSVRISMTRTGKVYMHIPIYKPIKELPKSAEGHLVSLDPGSNPFLAYYSPTKHIAGSFGTLPDVERFRRMQKKVDKINSVTDKNSANAPWIDAKTRKRTRVNGLRIREKATNLAKDAVGKVTNFLSAKFQYVHASPFEVSQMSVRLDYTAKNLPPQRRRIRKQTVRDLRGWLHYPFKETLKHKATLIRGLVAEFISEVQTTKCCDSCGASNEVGSKKLFVCTTCGHTLHREVPGARNYALRNCVGRYTLP